MMSFKEMKQILRYTYLWIFAGLLLYLSPISLFINMVILPVMMYYTIDLYREKYPMICKFLVNVPYILAVNLVLQSGYYLVYTAKVALFSGIRRDFYLCISFALLIALVIAIYKLYSICVKVFLNYSMSDSILYNAMLYAVLSIMILPVTVMNSKSEILNYNSWGTDINRVFLIFIISLLFVWVYRLSSFSNMGYSIILAGFAVSISYICGRYPISKFIAPIILVTQIYFTIIAIQQIIKMYRKKENE